MLWILCCVPLYYSKCPGRSCVLGLYFRSLPTGATTRRGSLLVLLDVLGEACVAASLVRVANKAALVHGALPNRAPCLATAAGALADGAPLLLVVLLATVAPLFDSLHANFHQRAAPLHSKVALLSLLLECLLVARVQLADEERDEIKNGLVSIITVLIVEHLMTLCSKERINDSRCQHARDDTLLPQLDLPDFLELEDELAKPVVLVDLACTLSKL